ncbi:MAG TPA: cupin domain-containing protein [Opitutaceae bacterium]|nr:cupin domain-containing protein [Opitutaceae bacterium]
MKNPRLSTPLVLRAGAAPKLPVFGVDVEVLLDGSQTDGEMAVYRATAPAGSGAPPHRHAGQDEMFHVLAGAFDLDCDGVRQRLHPGDFAFVPRGASHAFTCVGPENGSVLIIGTPAGHEAFFRDVAGEIATGTFTPERGAAICLRHGIELVGAPA